MASLVNGFEGAAYTIAASDLLLGFTDPEGGSLQVADRTANGVPVPPGGLGGTWVYTPAVNFAGPVELAYSVHDALGKATPANQMFVVSADHEATGALSVAGMAQEGGSLVASLSAVSDADGATTSAYQWQEFTTSAWVDIAGANTDTLAIPSDQSFVGKELRVMATSTDALGGTTAFEGSGQVVANVNDAPTGGVTVAGTPTEGQTLSAGNSLADADGLGPIGYQWLSDGAPIPGAIGNALLLGPAQVGHGISVAASYIDLMGTHESVGSSATAAVAGEGGGVTLNGTPGPETLGGGAGNDLLNGLGGNDTLNGNGGHDTLDGGSGSDKMAGGTGDDTCYVDSYGDGVIEAAGAAPTP